MASVKLLTPAFELRSCTPATTARAPPAECSEPDLPRFRRHSTRRHIPKVRRIGVSALSALSAFPALTALSAFPALSALSAFPALTALSALTDDSAACLISELWRVSMNCD